MPSERGSSRSSDGLPTRPAHRLERSAFDLEFAEDFDRPTLDPARWIAHYLPHWSTPDRTAARYAIENSRLRLLIEADQPPWCPELDGDLRVSSIQTAEFAGPVGSSIGGHPFDPPATVRTAQPARRLYTPHLGLVELRCRAIGDSRSMVALWMIGVGDHPEQTGEICVAEIFGRDIGAASVQVGTGVHPFGDGSIGDDFEAVTVRIDAREPHTYSAVWTPDWIAWYIDDGLVRVVEQSLTYPLQLMLSCYEFPAAGHDERRAADYPKAFEIDWVRGYRLIAGQA
jgi:Glycosyl hydrolases family 16